MKLSEQIRVVENVIGELKGENITTINVMQQSDDMDCLLYTSPSPRDRTRSRMPSSA